MYIQFGQRYCWDGHDNTIPPFPHGPGVSKSRYWVDGKLMPESFSTRDVREGSAFLSEVSFPLGEGTYKGTLIIRPPHRRNLAYAFQYQHAQYCKIAYVTYPPGTAVPWGQHGIELPTPTESPSDPSDVVNETKWSVNAHPVHWIFHTDGTVEAPGIWSGTWKKTGDEYRVNIIVRGVSDSFIVKFSSDGKSFTAYKNGKIYRNAIRVQ